MEPTAIGKISALTPFTDAEDEAASAGVCGEPYLLFCMKDVWNQKKNGQLS